MKIKFKATIVILVVSAILVGCSDSLPQQETESHKSEDSDNSDSIERAIASGETKKYKTLSEDSILISVNGKTLTKGTFNKWVDLRKEMVKKANPQTGSRDDGETTIIEQQMLATVTNDFVQQTVLSDYAIQKGIVASSNRIQNCQTAFANSARIHHLSWGNVRSAFKEELRQTIDDRVMVEALIGTVFDSFAEENDIKVDDDEVNRLFDMYVAYNKKCSATNEATWVKASNIWNRVIAGENFEDLAIQFDEDEYREDDGIWGDFQASNFTDEPEIWKLVAKFRPGYVSPPVEADNGIVILKVNSIEDEGYDVNAPDYVPSPSAEINMSRIFIHLPLFYEEVDREQFAKQCQAAKKTAEFNKFIRELISKADIQYPCGTAIFGSGENNSQMPFMAQ